PPARSEDQLLPAHLDDIAAPGLAYELAVGMRFLRRHQRTRQEAAQSEHLDDETAPVRPDDDPADPRLLRLRLARALQRERARRDERRLGAAIAGDHEPLELSAAAALGIAAVRPEEVVAPCEGFTSANLDDDPRLGDPHDAR